MSKITNIINAQAFEIIRDRIGTILQDEIDNQSVITYDPYLASINVTIENKAPTDITELPTINVAVASGDYGNKNQGSVDGTYSYNIDVYTCAESTSSIRGDKKSTLYLQRIIGLIRYILEDPTYKTLGYNPLPVPIILGTMVSNVSFKEIDKDDSYNVAMGRVVFTVKANESNKLIIPNLISGYQTTINLSNTALGYFYED